jgi:hypothetical protein
LFALRRRRDVSLACPAQAEAYLHGMRRKAGG